MRIASAYFGSDMRSRARSGATSSTRLTTHQMLPNGSRARPPRSPHALSAHSVTTCAPCKQTEITGSDTARGRGTANTNPAGWQYLDGEIGFARGHLLGRQLGGNGRDRRNPVKMYNTANSEVMAEYEGIVRRRLDGGERIFYVSVPQYDGSNPMPDSIELYALGNQGFYGQWTVHNTPDGLPPMNGLTP